MRIDIPVLNSEYKVIVVFGKPKEVLRVLKKEKYPKTHISFDNARGLCVHAKGYPPVIAMPCAPYTTTGMGTLAHEATHAVDFIMRSIGEDTTTTEVYAHCVGAVVREALEAWEQKQKKKKKKNGKKHK